MSDHTNGNNIVVKRERPARACTARPARLYAEAAVVAGSRKKKSRRRRHFRREIEDEEEEPPSPPNPYGDVVTPLVREPPLSQLARWSVRSMWELASILNFLNVFRSLLMVEVEFSVEELESALITPNGTLADLHIPLLKAIPPIARTTLGKNTWVTVLCRKLRDWWHWVAEGDLPIVASHGAEIETYNALDPTVRVIILKALCDIRVEQDDIRSYIEDSIKHSVPVSSFRKECTGGDSRRVFFWYEDDPVIGQRLYREIRKIEVKKGKGKNVLSVPSYQWETVATSLDEFQDVSEKLLASKNRIEASLGKKLKNDMLPEIEKVHKRREKLIRKQHRQALLLDSMIVDRFGPGRSLRGRKPVSYTFDDYDRSINEAVKTTKKKHMSPEPSIRREGLRHGRWGGPSQNSRHASLSPSSPDSPDCDGTDEDHPYEQLDRSNRRRQRPQRFSASEFVEEISDNDIVGEAAYDEEYTKRQKGRRKTSSSSEGDDEYRWDQEENNEEEEDDAESLSASDDSNAPPRFKKLRARTRRETKVRSVGELGPGLRRSKRVTRNRIDYTRYEFSESEHESTKPEKSKHKDESDNSGFSMESDDDYNEEVKIDGPVIEEQPKMEKEESNEPKLNGPVQDECGGLPKRRFLDLNELAPGSGYEDGAI